MGVDDDRDLAGRQARGREIQGAMRQGDLGRALPVQLGRIDVDEAYPSSDALDCVAVDRLANLGRGLRRRRLGRRASGRDGQHGRCENNSEHGRDHSRSTVGPAVGVRALNGRGLAFRTRFQLCKFKDL